MRTFWIGLPVALFIGILTGVCIARPVALFLVVPLLALFIYNGLQKVPAKPPHKAILVFLGRRLKIVLNEGWNFLPIYPFVFDFVLIKVEKVNYDLEPQEVRTPDRAVISVKASVTWIPGIQGSPESYIDYLNSGGEEGVRKIIHDVIEDRTKTWAGSNREGPSTWMEAQVLKDDAHEVLVKSLLGGTLVPIGNPIPTNTWMRFFDSPQSEPTAYDTARRPGQTPWAFKDGATGDWNWSGLQAIYDGYSPADQSELKRKVDQRIDDVRKMREGKGEFGDKSLGITIVRFSVNDIKVTGEVARAAELEEKERRERDADTMELDNVSARIRKLRKENRGMSLEEAIRTVQIERGKISKSVIEVLGASTGLGQDFLGALGFQKMPGGGNVPAGNPAGKKGGKKNRGDYTDDDIGGMIDDLGGNP